MKPKKPTPTPERKPIGRPKRGEGTVKRSVTVQAAAWEIVDAAALEIGRSGSEMLERIIMEWAAKGKKGGKK